jgi:hypothetical protein
MKKIIRLTLAACAAFLVSGLFTIFMLLGAINNMEADERSGNLQYTCASSDNYAQCYKGETGHSLISISGGGMSFETHVVVGGIMAVAIFSFTFLMIGFPSIRKKLLVALEEK